MPLINLKTNLKDLKFGSDRLNSGKSNQPYITFPTDEGSTTQDPYKTYYNTNRTSRDFPIRGGGFVDQLNSGLGGQTIAAQIDKERIEKFLKDGERGPAFIRKQVGLQLSNPKMQTSEVNPNFKLDDFPGLIENTRIYNQGRNTLTSVQYAGTGVFLNRAGALPINPREKFYKDVMREELLLNSNQVEGVNRLLILRQLKLSSEKSDPVANISDFTIVNKLGISLNRNRIFEYLGGPGSVYGIGSTTVKRAYDTSEAVNKNTYPGGTVINRLTFTYDNLLQQQGPSLPGPDGIIRSYSDFRDKVGKDTGGFAGKKLPGNWATDNRETRFMDGPADKINILPVIKFDPKENPWSINSARDAYENVESDITSRSDDMIKFVFECISNDSDTEDVALFFRAYLGSINDSHKASWNGFKYMGRGENFYTYQGVDRTFSTSFKIAIGTRQELNLTYDKLNYLVSQVYPDYSETTKFMRAPLMRLTIGDYLFRAFGYLENVDISIEDKNSWEIQNNYQLPRYLNVSFAYKIIEKTLPQRGRAGLNLTKFIGEPTLDAYESARSILSLSSNFQGL
jgi:hypothetical protein